MNWRLILSALIAGIISGSGAVTAAATQPTGMTDTAWLVAAITGLVTALKDIQAFLQQPK